MSAGEKPTTDVKCVDGVMWLRVPESDLGPGEREAWSTSLDNKVRLNDYVRISLSAGNRWVARVRKRTSMHERWIDAARWAHLHRFSGPHEYDGPGRPVPPHKSGGGQWG